MKQTSREMSSMAARYMGMTDDQMREIFWPQLCRDLRSLAASCLSQDETPGGGDNEPILQEVLDKEIPVDDQNSG